MLVGTAKLLAERGVEARDAEGRAGALAAEGKTSVYAAVDGRIAGILAVADRVRPEAGEAIAALQRLGLETALALSRATIRTVRQNLFWAFVYNAIGIPVAAGLLYPVAGWLLSPVLASAAMSISSVSVVANSLRLRRFRAPLVGGT